MLLDVMALKGTLKLRQQVQAGGGAGRVVSSSTLPFRYSATGLALALTDVMDILNSNFKVQAPGGMGYGCRGGFALVSFTLLRLAGDLCKTSMDGLGNEQKLGIWICPLRAQCTAHARQ